MGSEYEVCNIINSSKDWVPFSNSAVFLIPYRIYHEDLAKSMKTRKDVRRQLEVDLPRCKIFKDGDLIKDWTQSSIPLKLQRFCTQTIMGMPVCVLQSLTENIICESGERNPLTFDIWGEEYLIVSKQLSVRNFSTYEIEEKISIEIRINLNDYWILILFKKSNVHQNPKEQGKKNC